MASQPFQQYLRHIHFGNWTSQESILASHPSQPLFTTHIFSKIKSLKEHFFKTRQVTQVNHNLRHTYFRKIEHREKISSEDWKSPKSTGNCNIHILENQIFFELVEENRQVNQVNQVNQL